MPWIGGGAPHAKQPEAGPPASSLEHETAVSARGINPAAAVIEHLTATECRLRTVVFFDRGEEVGFDFTTAAHGTVHAKGHVVSRASKGPRFVYRVRLDRMSPKDVDRLARSVAEAHRRQARSRVHSRAIADLPTTDHRLTRSALRVPSHLPISYRTAKESSRTAEACDVSAGGMAIVCDRALVAGETIEVRFTLPSAPLEVHPEETAILDLRTRNVTRARSDLRRPFEEMVLRARIVTHQPLGNGLFRYGIAFCDLNEFAREEIARYVHAVHLLKRRNAST